MSDSPIGIFDSGLGGLSVYKELISHIPNEQVIYFGDSGNAPYGPKSTDYIIKRSTEITEFLLSKGCKIIIVACNTATAAAISHLRAKFDTPFIGMEPAIKPAAKATKTGSIGVLGTQGTFSGRHYQNTKAKYANNVNVIYRVATGLVEYVEHGEKNDVYIAELLTKYIKPMLLENIDHLVLGCTHYPFLSDDIQKVAGSGVTLVNPANAVVRHTLSVLKMSGLLNTSKSNREDEFFTTGDIEKTKRIVDSITMRLNIIKPV
jgi:glutamate racemase